MDFNKLKVYGFPRAMTKFKKYLPSKVEYLQSKDFGYLEAPKNSRCRELRILHQKYLQRVEYEKYMNPKGLKYTHTSNFPKIANTIDCPNPKLFMVRSQKIYHHNQIKFMVDKNASKPEIKQFLTKVYNLDVKDVATAILPGEVKRKVTKRGNSYMRTRDIKKAVVTLDFPVDNKFKLI